MASPHGSAGAAAPKSLSSRLLTMKFMQRGVAGGGGSSSPNPRSPATPELPPSAKRRKTEDFSPALVTGDAIQAALADEEAKKLAALERQAAEAGDSRWVLEDLATTTAATPESHAHRGAIQVVAMGYAALDAAYDESRNGARRSSMEEEETRLPEMIQGRRLFGSYKSSAAGANDDGAIKRKRSVLDPADPDQEDGEVSSPGSDEEEDEHARDRRAAEELRIKRLHKQHGGQHAKKHKQAKDQARIRRKKEVKLNHRTSLSGRQDRPPSSKRRSLA